MSHRLRRSLISALQLVIFPLWLASGLQAIAQSSGRPMVTTQINDQLVTRLEGNTHPLAVAKNDRGAFASSEPLNRMLLVLKRSTAQDQALSAAIQAMHQPGSPTFHKWLTADQIGTMYGPAQADIDKVTSWLGSHGFTVASISKSHSTIEFSGTEQSFASAFHTEMHSFEHNGNTYSANASDPSIPAALAPVVAGFASLNNFPRNHINQQPAVVKYDKTSKKWLMSKPPSSNGTGAQTINPAFTTVLNGDTYYAVTPADFATIYNLNPLYQQGIDGTGQQIAVVSESNIAKSDVDAFRASFGLPATKLNIILNGPDPGQTIADGAEPSLDAEWTGAVAKNAMIDFVVSKTTTTTAGIDLSAEYIVDNQVAPVLSESYGNCELSLGASGNVFYYQLWQQAAAQDITAVISAGDSGAATCDDGYTAASYGNSVNGIASTPYTVTIGGTDFEASALNPSAYWNATNTSSLESAISYIPEVPWNDSCASPNINALFAGYFGSGTAENLCNNPSAQTAFLNVEGGGGGASNCITTDAVTGNCTGGYPQPSWQNNINGVADGKSRYIPDVSLFAANGVFGSFYLFCDASLTTATCNYNDPDNLNYFAAGGTSFGAPAFAGIMALVNQKTNSSQGVANYVLYELGRQEYGTTTSPNTTQTNACNSSTGQANGNACTFYDVTQGANSVPCYTFSTGCVTANPNDEYGILPGYSSNSGFDAVTGLGTINATNLVNNWSLIAQSSSATTLSITPAQTTYGNPTTVSGMVTSSAGTPTGEVVLQGDLQSFGSIQLANGLYQENLSVLPAGSYSATASYLCDGTFAKSISAPVTLTINKAPGNGTLSFSAYDPFSQSLLSTTSSIPYGSSILGTFTGLPASSAAGLQLPTGTVTFTQGTTTISKSTITNGVATGAATAKNIGPGSWSAVYGGDTNYLAGSPITGNFTVVKANTALESHSTASVVIGSSTFTLNATITTNSYASAPTGAITFFINGNSVGTATVSSGTNPVSTAALATASLTVPASQLQVGNNLLTATYSGDSNYNTSQSAQTGIVYSSASLTSTIALTTSSATTSNIVPVTLTAAVANSGSPASVGLVSFFDGTRLLSRVSVVGVNPATGATTGTAKLVTLLPIGQHSITATYAGVTGAIAPATSTPAGITVTGTLPTSVTITAKGDTLFPANYQFTADVYAGGKTIPTAPVTLNETSLGTTLGQISLDPTTAVTGFTPEKQIAVGGTPQQALPVDLNGDGILDLAVSTDDGQGQTAVQVFLGKGDGTFGDALPNIVINNPNVAGPRGIAVGDFNGDGIQDLVLNFNNGGYIATLLGKGDGTFTAQAGLYVPGSYPLINNLVVDDFNGDGILDMAFADGGDATVDVALGNGDGTFRNPTTTRSTITARIGTADMNQDGKADLVVLHINNEVGIMLGNGDGTFKTEVQYPTTGHTPFGMSIADVNGDGYPDVVTADEGDSTVAVLLNKGTGALGSGITYTVGYFPQSVTIGDVNGDGNADIVSGNNGAGSMSILYGKGDGTFNLAQTIPTAKAPLAPIIADLNNDGLADIIVNENQNGTTGIFLSGTTITGSVNDIAVQGATTEVETVTGTFTGDKTYAASTSPAISLSASGAIASTHSTWSPAVTTGTYGTLIPSAALNAKVTGNVAGTFTYSTVTLGGATIPVTAATILPSAGTYTITATFTPTSTVDYASSSAQATFTVTKAGVAQALAVSATTVSPGSPLTLTDTVTSSTTGTPTGVVTFYSGTNSIGAGTLDGTGKATLVTSNLPNGTNSLTASYLGDGNFSAQTSTATPVTVGAQTFVLSVATPSLNVTAGSSATDAVSVVSQLNYSGNVALSCGNLPVGITCGFSPATGAVTGTSSVQSTLTITAAAPGVKAANESTPTPWLPLGGGTALAWLVFVAAPRSSRRRLRGLIVLALCVGLMSFAIGCGGNGSNDDTLTLTSSTAKTASGSALTLSTVVGGAHSSNATGTVTFYDGAIALGSPVTVASGAASLSVQSLSVGIHTITATYSGDSNNSAAPSNALQQVITGQTSIQVTAVSGVQSQTTSLNVTLQ